MDENVHKGSTWIKGPNGQEYELNGTFNHTATGLVVIDMIQKMDANGNIEKEKLVKAK